MEVVQVRQTDCEEQKLPGAPRRLLDSGPDGGHGRRDGMGDWGGRCHRHSSGARRLDCGESSPVLIGFMGARVPQVVRLASVRWIARASFSSSEPLRECRDASKRPNIRISTKSDFNWCSRKIWSIALPSDFRRSHYQSLLVPIECEQPKEEECIPRECCINLYTTCDFNDEVAMTQVLHEPRLDTIRTVSRRGSWSTCVMATSSLKSQVVYRFIQHSRGIPLLFLGLFTFDWYKQRLIVRERRKSLGKSY